MERILKDINAVVGVTGCFISNGEGQILASTLPDIFDRRILSTVGRTMVQSVVGLETVRRKKVGDIVFVFDQGSFITKNLGESCLCILCVRNINVPLLNLTANLVARKLTEQLKSLRPVEPKVEVPEEVKLSPIASVDGTFFSQIEHELTKIMGPVATLIIDGELAAIGTNKDVFPPERLSELLDNVSTRIADEGKRANFRQAMLNIIESLR